MLGEGWLLLGEPEMVSEKFLKEAGVLCGRVQANAIVLSGAGMILFILIYLIVILLDGVLNVL